MIGRVTGAHKVAQHFDQTAMIEFENGETRSILAKYIVPIKPEHTGVEALVLHGRRKGQVVKVRDIEVRTVTVSVDDMSAWDDLPKEQLCVLVDGPRID